MPCQVPCRNFGSNYFIFIWHATYSVSSLASLRIINVYIFHYSFFSVGIDAVFLTREPLICLFQLHLGVNSGAFKFAIEQQAVNEATFRCPDELGWQPQVCDSFFTWTEWSWICPSLNFHLNFAATAYHCRRWRNNLQKKGESFSLYAYMYDTK